MTSIVGTGARRRAVVEGTFTRSMLAAAVRGLGLVAAAVLVGVVLLQVTEDSSAPPPAVAAGPEPTTTTTTTDGLAPEGGLRPPSQVQVLVLNAARIEGAAGDITAALQALGHPTLPAGNAPTQPDTVVYYKPGFEQEAQVVVPTVGDTAIAEPLPEPSPFAGTEEADLVVVIGSDFQEPTTLGDSAG